MNETKLNVGREAEGFVQAVAEKAFSPDFVFRSPQKLDGKEVTDVLVLFDDVGLVIQAKAQSPGPEGAGYDPDPSPRWTRKNLSKAANQIKGAQRAIREGRLKDVENVRRGGVPFVNSQYPFLYGLILLDHKSDPYDPHEVAPELTEIPAPVHVISFEDFMRLGKALDTPMDFINYLEARADIIPLIKPRVHEENKAFRYYLENLETIIRVRANSKGKSIKEEEIRRYAADLRQTVLGSHPNQRFGVIIDHLIERLHDLDPDIRAASQPRVISNEQAKVVYAPIATELGRLPRMKRIEYGHAYLNIAIKASETQKTHRVRIYSRRQSLCILLVSSPLPRTERRKRSEELVAITSLAKAYHQVHRAIGVATEAGDLMGSSYDVAFLESPPEHDERAMALGKEIFEKDPAIEPTISGKDHYDP